MAVHPLRPATRRRLGRPLPHQQADRPQAHPTPKKLSTTPSKAWSYPVLDPVSQAYPKVQGRSLTCYSPVRHSSTSASTGLSVRLACVKHAASVHPEPGSNSPQKGQNQAVKSPNPTKKTKQKTVPGPDEAKPKTKKHEQKIMHPPAHTNHTPKHRAQPTHQQTHNQKNNWHTIEFSNTTHTPNHPSQDEIVRSGFYKTTESVKSCQLQVNS